MLEAAYRKDGPNGQLEPLAEPICESSAGEVVEQTVESSPVNIRQTPNGASPSAVLPMPHQMERRPEPSDEEIRLRAYFLSERRRRFALPGDADSDWHEAKRQLICQSGELTGLSAKTSGDSGRILRRNRHPLPCTGTRNRLAVRRGTARSRNRFLPGDCGNLRRSQREKFCPCEWGRQWSHQIDSASTVPSRSQSSWWRRTRRFAGTPRGLRGLCLCQSG